MRLTDNKIQVFFCFQQSRTLTPLITQTLKSKSTKRTYQSIIFSFLVEARLLASRLSQETSVIIPPQLSVSTTVHEETLIEEPPPPPLPSIIPDAHVTLRDVSFIEKEIEMDHNIPNPELSVSLLPCIPTANLEEEDQNNKSIASTISDKTFVKTSLRPFSSEEESDDDDDDDDDTIIEESLIADNTENARPLLLTADRSIRRPAPPPREEKLSLSNQPSIEKPQIKQQKVSFREPLNIEHNRPSKTSLLNKSIPDAEKSNYIRPTIIDNPNTSKLPTIASADS